MSVYSRVTANSQLWQTFAFSGAAGWRLVILLTRNFSIADHPTGAGQIAFRSLLIDAKVLSDPRAVSDIFRF
jgi:hypothetical protein